MRQVTKSTRIPEKVLIALGSNANSQLGGSRKILTLGLVELDGDDVSVLEVSRHFQTPCFPAGAGPDYVNAAAVLETTLSPTALMARLLEVEKTFGRMRVERWGQRTLDIDMIAYGGQTLPDAETVKFWMNIPLEEQKAQAPGQLIVPHPRVHERAFVLIPLSDIAPDWRHPVLGKTVREMTDALPEGEKSEVLTLPGMEESAEVPCQ